MKTAIISDIHGNSQALAEVLRDARGCGCEHLFVLGDLIGYYYDAGEVLDLLAAFPSRLVIGGNHERLLRSMIVGEVSEQDVRKKYGSGHSLAIEQLSLGQLDYLCRLPESIQTQLGPQKGFLCHASPKDPDAYIYPDAPRQSLEACAIGGYHLVVLAHTHYPMCVQVGSTLIINPGSVGQPRDSGSLASYVIHDTENGALAFRRLQFDSTNLQNRCRKLDPHLPYLWEVFTRNGKKG